jgi:hypothetical protein
MVDARNGSLLVRLAAADAQLNTRSMVLGLKHQYGSRAEHAQKAVMAVIQDMCTGGRGAPGRQGNVMCDADLAEHIRQIVEVFAADAASDEQLAGRELQSPADGGPAMLPNLKIVVRDKAHASRRLLSRPWAADAYLNERWTPSCSNTNPLSVSSSAASCSKLGSLQTNAATAVVAVMVIRLSKICPSLGSDSTHGQSRWLVSAGNLTPSSKLPCRLLSAAEAKLRAWLP